MPFGSSHLKWKYKLTPEKGPEEMGLESQRKGTRRFASGSPIPWPIQEVANCKVGRRPGRRRWRHYSWTTTLLPWCGGKKDCTASASFPLHLDFLKILISLFVTGLCPCCCTRAFWSQRVLCCRARALGSSASVVASHGFEHRLSWGTHGLSCSASLNFLKVLLGLSPAKLKWQDPLSTTFKQS